MREADYPDFVAMLDAVCGLLSRGQYVPNAAHAAMWFRALSEHDLRTVRAAFDAHVDDPQRGRFVPVPADIKAQIAAADEHDGRPGAEEAWSIALRGADERATIVWTDEMAEAWGSARHVMAAGDEVGARMAFREAYTRLVAKARAERRPVRWTPSLGHDDSERSTALRAAEAAGLLPAPHVEALLPEPEVAQPPHESVAALLLRVRDGLVNRVHKPSVDAADRMRTAELREASRSAVEAYAEARGLRV